MQLDERAEEILEALWVHREGNAKSPLLVAELGEDLRGGPLDELERAEYVARGEGAVALTQAGEQEARSVIRRHRLAERLLADVLDSHDILEEKACKFEHLLDRGLDESICILLGHPRVCPHGKPIPPGKCCEMKLQEAGRVVAPLSQLEVDHTGRVAYLAAAEHGMLQKLMAMGILPGTPMRMLQRFPSYVFEAGHTQFAVDQSIADAIYVRLSGDEVGGAAPRARGLGRLLRKR